MAWRQRRGGSISFCGGGVEVVSLFMGFCGFVHGFPAFELDLGGVWVVGFRSVGCDFFPMGWGICCDGFDGGFRCLLGLFGSGFR